MSKLLSVIIPCYNAEKYIEKCIESLLAQTLGLNKMELIFVNDASTDSTLDILLEYEKKYSDTILIINQPENRKQGAARNVGIDYSSGEYIAFCDADDYVESDMYEILCNRIIQANVNMAVCGKFNDYEDGSSIPMPLNEDTVLDISNALYPTLSVYAAAPSLGCFQRIYKKDWLDKIQIRFPEDIKYEDNYFCAFLPYYLDKLAVISKPLYHYKLHSASTIHEVNASHHLDRLIIETMKIEGFKERGLFDKHKDEIEFHFLELFFVNTIFILKTRFTEIPEGVLNIMQETVKDLFPEWSKNPLLNKIASPEFKKTCSLIDYQFKTGSLEELLSVSE